MEIQRTNSSQFICSFCLLIFVIGISKDLHAFDGATNVDTFHLNRENFLDIQSYSFSAAQDRKWRRAEQGWRMTGGSLGLDLLFMKFQLKLIEQLSKGFSAGVRIDHEEFYERKPLNFEIEVGWKATYTLTLGIAGQPQFDKRNADYGAFITFGERQKSFLRVHQLRQNLFYNEKNLYDQSTQNPHPIENQVEGTWLSDDWEFGFKWTEFLPMKLLDSTVALNFFHEEMQQQLLIEYQWNPDWTLGWQLKKFRSVKRREVAISPDPADHRHQEASCSSQILQADGPLAQGWYLNAGLRYDMFRHHLLQLDAINKSEENIIHSYQWFGSMRQLLGDETAWEAGIYLGQVGKSIINLEDFSNKEDRSHEGKLRISWEVRNDYVSGGALMFTSTWNLDNFANDFWDGGNVTYQRTF
jgi:hypothetical protein